MESRAAYGYYGEGYGATGESVPITHKSGWRYMDFGFEIHSKTGKENIRIKACDYAHAISQLKKWAKKDGFEIIGDAKGYEKQRNW